MTVSPAQARGNRRHATTEVDEPVSRSDPFSFLAAEHALLRQQFARALVSLEAGADPADVRAALATLESSLCAHQDREDVALYPMCERLFGEGGAASVLRSDHAAIARQLEILGRESKGTGRVLRLRLNILRTVVDEHFGKEERVLFPLTAARLSGSERSTLARRLRLRHRVAPEG